MNKSFLFLSNLKLIAKDKAKAILNYKHTRLLAEPPYHDDLYVVSYPKSGITWLSFLMANVIKLKNNLEQEINFFNVQDYIPDIHVSRNLSRNSFLKWPGFRIIKSHSDFNPYYTKVIYLVRDPRDVMASYWHFTSTLKQFNGSLSELIRDEKLGIKAWANHVRSWMEDAPASVRITFMKYEELKHDTAGTLKRVYSLMGYELDDDALQGAIGKSSFDQMKLLEENYGYGGRDVAKKLKFMRKGKVGAGKEEMSEDDLAYIRKIAGKWLEKLRYE